MQAYLQRSREVKKSVLRNNTLVKYLKDILQTRNNARADFVFWHGESHFVYPLGQLDNGFWVVGRQANIGRVLNPIEDLEYCATKMAEQKEGIVPSFAIGITLEGVTFPVESRRLIKKFPCLLLTEDLTQGGSREVRNVSEQEYGLIGDDKAYYDFDGGQIGVIRSLEETIYFNAMNRLSL
jgi:hypothetical protein